MPAAWLLTRRVQSRIFQHQTVPQILQTILRDEWQLSLVNRLAGQYPERTFCDSVPRVGLGIRRPADGRRGNRLLFSAR